MNEWMNNILGLIKRMLIVLMVLCSGLNHYQVSYQSDQNWLHLPTTEGLSLDNVMRADACDKSRRHCVKDVLLIRGMIGLQTYFDLKRLYQQRTVKTICVDSPGGVVPMAVVIAKWIYANSLSTCMAELYLLHEFSTQLVNAECHSACPLVLAAGKQRWSLGETPTVGVHQGRAEISWCFCQLTIPISGSVTSFVSLMPPSTASFDLLFAMTDKAPPAQIYRLNTTELAQVNMFTNSL